MAAAAQQPGTGPKHDDEATRWRILRRLSQAATVFRAVLAGWGWYDGE